MTPPRSREKVTLLLDYQSLRSTARETLRFPDVSLPTRCDVRRVVVPSPPRHNLDIPAASPSTKAVGMVRAVRRHSLDKLNGDMSTGGVAPVAKSAMMLPISGAPE